MNDNIKHKLAKPEGLLADFVYCFSYIQNLTQLKEGIVIPNGRIDLSFYKTPNNKCCVSLRGLETYSKTVVPESINAIYAVSFNPLAAEYIFKHSVADILNKYKVLDENFWDFNAADLDDFDSFCQKASQTIKSHLPIKIDERKRKLFALIYATNGEMSVKELSEKVFYSARQINAYFNQQFGVSLKAYCSILRFQASLSHIGEGKFFPELNYYDQSHFIKETKKLSGTSPKELFKNKDSRFLQFLTANENNFAVFILIAQIMLLQNKKVAVIGAGPVGLAFARLLQQAGVNVRVYERDINEQARIKGGTLDLLKDMGQVVFERAGLLSAYFDNARPTARRMADIHGNIIQTLPASDNPEIDRNDLRRILLENLQPQTVVWNRKLISLEKKAGIFQLHFENKSIETADLIVGANGIMSRLRKEVTDAPARYTGMVTITGEIHDYASHCPNFKKYVPKIR